MVDEEVEVAGGSGHEFLVEERLLYLSDVEPGPRGQTHGYRTPRRHSLPVVLIPVVPNLRVHRSCQPHISMKPRCGKRYEHMTDGRAS